MNKMFFFDIDGTLVDCPHGLYNMSFATKEALDELKKNNNYVFLSTGRCKCFILDEVMAYPFDGYVTCNGSYVEYNNKTVYKSKVSQEAINKTRYLAQKYDWLYYFEANDKIYVRDKTNKRHIKFRDSWKMKEETIVDNFDSSLIETYIGMIVLNKESELEIVQRELGNYFDIQRHMQGISFDLTLKNESKGKGIKEMVKYLNLNMRDTIAFGDGRNDLEMLETVGQGIAMGNSPKETKEASDYVTKGVLEEGIVYALKRFSYI